MNHRYSRLAGVLVAAACAVGAGFGADAAAGTAPEPTTASPTASVQHTAARLVSPHVVGRHAATRRAANQQSQNWSGYIKSGKAMTSATATWHVPTLSTKHAGYSSTWVGIDGASANDRYLIQTGTEGDVINGRAYYAAWWEVITPSDEAPETRFSLTVHAGDSMSASVAKTTSGRWTMRLADNTTGHSASHTVSFAGPGSSAEWIQEDTDVNGSISTAPDWGTVTFSHLTVNKASPHLTASQAVDIVDSRGTREDVTSAPTASGSGFSVKWLAAGTRTSVT